MAVTTKERRKRPRGPITKAKFFSRLQVRSEDDGTWTLSRDLVYGSALTGKVYRAPKGFNTDLDSVPRWPVIYLAAKNRARDEAALHDFLYRTGAESRTMCDAIFKEAMTVKKMDGFMKNLIWLGVRVGGRRHHIDTTAKPENVAPPTAPASTAQGE